MRKKKLRRRHNKALVKFIGKFVDVRGRPGRQIFRNFTVKKRYGRRAMSHLFMVSKPMKAHIKLVLSGFNR